MESINPPSHLAGEFEVEHAASDTVTDVTADANAAGACVTLGWLRGFLSRPDRFVTLQQVNRKHSPSMCGARSTTGTCSSR